MHSARGSVGFLRRSVLRTKRSFTGCGTRFWRRSQLFRVSMGTSGTTLFEYILLALTSLFVIVDPIATVPAFLAMTPNDSPAERLRMARLASLVAAGVLIFFVVVGEALFHFL